MSNSSIWPLDKDFSGTSQSVPESNGNEGVLHIPQISKARALPSDGLMSSTGHLLRMEGSSLNRDAVSVFYSPYRMSLERDERRQDSTDEDNTAKDEIDKSV